MDAFNWRNFPSFQWKQLISGQQLLLLSVSHHISTELGHTCCKPLSSSGNKEENIRGGILHFPECNQLHLFIKPQHMFMCLVPHFSRLINMFFFIRAHTDPGSVHVSMLRYLHRVIYHHRELHSVVYISL